MKVGVHISLLFTAFLFTSAIAVGRTQALTPRDITGVVVEQSQNPLKGAKVCAFGTRPMGGVMPCSDSSSDGQFRINVYATDTYTIFAEDFELGYPTVLLRVPGTYGKPDPIFPKVIVDDSAVPSPVKVVMGAKAGRLVLTILDGNTNQVVESGSIRFSTTDHPELFYEIGTAFPKGHFEVLTPETPFTINFATWYGPTLAFHGGIASCPCREWVKRFAFDGNGLPLETLQINLGERKELTVQLK